MTVCCEVCQHPACWKAEIDIQRSSLQNEYGYFNIPVYYDNSLSNRYDARNECIVEIDGSLPTYKTLDLLESGFPSCDVKETSELHEDVSEFHPREISDGEKEQPRSGNGEKRAATYPFTNRSLSTYLKKLCDRHKEVEKQESNERKDISSGRHIVFKTLTIEDVQSFGDEYTKVYTWIPGKKSQNESAEESRESKEKVIALKMIDGADLPNCALSDDNKHRHKLRSQTTGLSFRRKTVHMPPLGSEDHDDYIQLLRYIDLTRLRCNKISMNNQDVRIPSPLQTARVKLYESSDDNKTLRHTSRTKHASTQQTQTQSADENTDETIAPRSKTMYIRNGVVLSKSPVLKKPERSKPTKRTPLPLTRVSVPKKAVRKLPLFDHCSSSIKKTDLPDVTMEPITSSENTSVLSLVKSANPSSAGDVPDMLHHAALSSPDMVRVPASSPLSMSSEVSTSPPIHRMEKESPTLYNIPSEDIINSTTKSHNDLNREVNFFETNETALLQRSEKESDAILGRSEKEISDRLYLDFDGEHKLHAEKSQFGTRIAPSAIMISKASKTDRSDMPAHRRQSPTMSLGSKGSLDGWLLDKDIITRTYDKYQSFSPFKTPHCSAHVIRNDLSRNLDTRVETSKRKILPPSLHNLDQYLPGQEESLRTNTSFTTRCLSPSRSMFIRQQKQPPIENVPSEIIVSRFPLLPAITKSQRSARGDVFSHKQNGTDIAYSDSPRYVEEITSLMDDDYEEEVEEVLLNKEAFSSISLCRVNNSPQPVSSDLQVTGTDPQAMDNDPSQTANPDSTVKNEKLMNSLNVSNRDILRPPSSNYLLLPNQGSNMVVPSSQHEDFIVADLDAFTSNIVDNNDRQFNAPQTHTHTNVSDESGVETVAPTNKHIPVTDEHLISHKDIKSHENLISHKNLISHENIISDENITISENIEIFDESVETSTSGEMHHASQEDIGFKTDYRQRESSEDTDYQQRESSADSLKALTPVSSEGNLTPMSYLTDEPVNDHFMESSPTSPVYVESECFVGTSDIKEVETMQSDDNEDSNNNASEQQVSGEADVTTCSLEKVDESIEIKVETERIEVIHVDANNNSDVIIKNDEVIEDIEDVGVINNSETKSEGEETQDAKKLTPDPVRSNVSFYKKDPDRKSSELSSRAQMSTSDMYYGSATRLADSSSVMKDIFNSQLKEKSSLYLTPSHADDFTEGLDLDLEVEEEIVRAIHGLEEFVLDSYEVEDN